MFWPRSNIWSRVLGMASRINLKRSQGSSFRYRRHASNVAPPHISTDQKPILSRSSAMGSMSSVRMRVASSDW